MMAQAGMDSEGWIKEVGSGGSETYTYKADVNTVKQAKAAGFENASAVFESVSVTAKMESIHIA
jgi:hypothetical protein